jgi:hypothetical protein
LNQEGSRWYIPCLFELGREVEEIFCAEIEIKEKVEDSTTFGTKQEVDVMSCKILE